MRKSLGSGMARAVSDLKKSAAAHASTARTERDLNGKVVFGGLGVVLLCMIWLYTSYAGVLRGGIVAAIVMMIIGFFFAAVSGNLVGLIGSSNNPISGLTLATLVIAALLMVHHRRLGNEWSRCRARRGSRGLRVVGGRGRNAPGLEGGPHSRRHSQQDADRRLHGRDRSQLHPVARSDAAEPGQHQQRWHRLRRSSTARPSGRTDGDAGQGHRRR